MNIPKKSAVQLTCGIVTALAIVSTGIFIRPEPASGTNPPLNAQIAPLVASYTGKAPYVIPAIKVAKVGKYAPSVKGTYAISQLTLNQSAWLQKMIGCESSGNVGAVNPKDKDNTPSYGLLQFKPGTFYSFAKLYVIPVTGYMNADEQVEIMVAMIQHHQDINWFQQFPACTRRYGQPPAN